MRMFLAILLTGMFMLSGMTQASYTGRLESLTATDRGIEFTVIIVDKADKEVYRSPSPEHISTHHQTVTEAVAQAKATVKLRTEEIYAHIENAVKIIKDHKVELESYSSTCDTFVPSAERGGTQ